MNKLLVLEINEIPLSVIHAYCLRYPESRLAFYLEQDRFCLTNAEDQPEHLLYPTQTWASMNTGKPFEEHKIKWFNDPKNYQDFYWAKIAAAGHATVLISSLHTSPLHRFLHTGNYKAVIPDFFAEDNDTFPENYHALQALNRELSFANRRSSSKKQTLLIACKHFMARPRFREWGLGIHSLKDLVPLLIDVAQNPEALRKCQFPLLMQIFLNELKQHQPALGVVGSNHVASAMHRYLHATPHITQHDEPLAYDVEWLNKHEKEVLSAVNLLDRWLVTIDKFAHKNDYALAMVSSMGQKLNASLTPDFLNDYKYDYRLQYPEKLFAELDVNLEQCQQIGAMVPQYAYRVGDTDAAKMLEQKLARFISDPKVDRYGHYTRTNQTSPVGIPLKGILFNVDRNQKILTITVMLKPRSQQWVKVGNKVLHYSDLGFERFRVNDHHSGTHSKQGVLFYNKKFATINQNLSKQINYLDVANLFINTIEG